jgi:hypothetical protein
MRMCELLVGLPDVNVLGVVGRADIPERHPGFTPQRLAD